MTDCKQTDDLFFKPKGLLMTVRHSHSTAGRQAVKRCGSLLATETACLSFAGGPCVKNTLYLCYSTLKD